MWENIEIPNGLIIDKNKWKYLCRCASKSKNVLITGPTGTAKTVTARFVAKAMERPFHIINMGATSDPRTSLIGNVQYDSEKGTFFSESAFVKEIQKENNVIILDEITRAHPDAWNILMSVIDPLQRYLRLDEHKESTMIKVHKSVSFIATANVGMKYTATRKIDRALLDRFFRIEMEPLLKHEEEELIKKLVFKNSISDKEKTMLSALLDTSDYLKKECRKDDGNISEYLSMRTLLEMASMLKDGFSFKETCELILYPFFENESGVNSERTYIKQYVQKFFDLDGNSVVSSNKPFSLLETD